MRRINKLYEITNNTIADFKTGTQQHIENAIQEMGRMLIRHVFPNLIITNGSIVIVAGVENSGSGANYVISNGVIAYKDPDMDEVEFFDVDPTTFTVTGGNNAVAVIVTTSYTGSSPQGDIADPVGMSDSTTQNIHDIRTVQIVNGNSGTPGYIGDYSTFKSLKKINLSFTDYSTQFNFTSTSYADPSSPIEVVTPDDNRSRTYLCIFSYHNDTQSAAAISYLDLKITDGTGTPNYGSQDSGKISGVGGEFAIPGCLQVIIPFVPPNTTIKIQGKYIGSSGDIKKVSLSLVEIGDLTT